MSDQTRIGASGFDDFERDILHSAEVLDCPSEAGKQRTRALLTLGAGAAVALGASSASSIAHKTAGLAAWKTLLLSVVGLAVVASAVTYAVSLRPRPTLARAAAAPSGVQAVPTEAPAPSPLVAAAPMPAAQADEAPTVETPRSSGSSRAAAPAVAPSSTSLARQMAVLDRARESLESGRAAEALSAVADFDRRFPGSPVSQEAAVLRIDALFSEGKAAEWTSLAHRFLADYPASSHAEHVNRLLHGGAAPGSGP